MSSNQEGRGKGRLLTNKLAGSKRVNNAAKNNNIAIDCIKKVNVGGSGQLSTLSLKENSVSNMANWLRAKNNRNNTIGSNNKIEIKETILNQNSNEMNEIRMDLSEIENVDN